MSCKRLREVTEAGNLSAPPTLTANPRIHPHLLHVLIFKNRFFSILIRRADVQCEPRACRDLVQYRSRQLNNFHINECSAQTTILQSMSHSEEGRRPRFRSNQALWWLACCRTGRHNWERTIVKSACRAPGFRLQAWELFSIHNKFAEYLPPQQLKLKHIQTYKLHCR